MPTQGLQRHLFHQLVTETVLIEEIDEFGARGDRVFLGEEAQLVFRSVVREAQVDEEPRGTLVVLALLDQGLAQFRRGGIQRQFDVEFLDEIVAGVGKQRHVEDAQFIAVARALTAHLSSRAVPTCVYFMKVS